MRENIDVIRVYNLVDEDGIALQLVLGRLKGSEDYLPDKGFRWSFSGTKIPMPVRAHTWFNGFPEETMINWLMDNGWCLQTSVNMENGKVCIYNAIMPSKGNENPTEAYQLTDEAIRRGKVVLKEAIRLLCNNGSVLSAISLYRYVHPCSLVEAKHAVDAIRFDNAP